MLKKKIELFVPGRLCILGEHSDWAGKYRNQNNKIEKGYAIVSGIEQGIYASVCKSDELIIKFNNQDKFLKMPMNKNKLKKVALEGDFWSYVAGTALVINEKYQVGGVEITILDGTLPIKKGLSSSAAICVLVVRAFNQLYNLNLTVAEEMNLAYLGEIATPSRCGKLDQACAFGKKPVIMTFDGDKIDVKPLKVGKDLYFVFANLNSKKDTIKILASLNKSYPFPQNDLDLELHDVFGKLNKKNVFEAVDSIEKGNLKKLGKIMSFAQQLFDEKVAKACFEELEAPVLHSVLKDEYIKKLTYGGKGVGSQGDGMVQFLAKDFKSQQKLKEYFENELNMKAYSLKIDKTNKITKAIIPVAGLGTRMYPMTKVLSKPLLPIVDSDGIIKPAIMLLLEELDQAGIEEICLIIDKDDKFYYDNLFKNQLDDKILSKLPKKTLNYEYTIERIGKKIKYVYQKEKLGLGHAISLCEDFALKENVLLVLGDQLYKTDNSKNCTEQLLEYFSKNQNLIVSVYNVPLKDVKKYGIFKGNIHNNENYFDIDEIYEKPTISLANKLLYTTSDNDKEKKFYAAFGEYILTPLVFKKLKQNIKNDKKENGEFQLTSVLSDILKSQKITAFIPNGKMLDIGNVDDYIETLVEKVR